MSAMLITRAAPLMVATMLVATPLWAQTTTTTPATPPTPAQTPSTDTGQIGETPSGTAHKAFPHHNRSAAVERQPGESMQTLVERRLADLHSRLHITSEQEPQWQQYTSVLRDNAQGIDQSFRQRAEKLPTMNAVDAMQSYAQIEQQRAEDGQKLVAAFQTLYASLSDQQKQAADQMFRRFAENGRQNHQPVTR